MLQSHPSAFGAGGFVDIFASGYCTLYGLTEVFSAPRQECLLKPAMKRFQKDIAMLSTVLMGLDVQTGRPSSVKRVLREAGNDGHSLVSVV